MNTTPAPRIASLDIVRGLIMVLMALDHARDFFHIDAFRFSPEDLQRSNLPLFFTRWITHLCAPLFLLLAGISISLYEEKKDKRNTAFYLLSRGLWLIVLEQTFVQLGWFFHMDLHHLGGFVIWVIGWSMVCMAVMIYLPKPVTGLIGISILLLHNLLDHVSFDSSTASHLFWSFLHFPAKTVISDQFYVFILYPLLPPLGIMLLGYFLGQWYAKDFPANKRWKCLLTASVTCLILFFVCRTMGIYGDMQQFAWQADTAKDVMSFFNVTKYPFSLHYCLATLGIGFSLLAFAEKMHGAFARVLKTFGKVPMFFYILHLYFLHALAVVLFTITEHQSLYKTYEQFLTFNDRHYGYTLTMVYVIWMFACVILFFLCKKYGAYKKVHDNIVTKLI